MKKAMALTYATDLERVKMLPLDERSRYLRGLIFRAIEKGGRGHIGPALSIVEIIRVLYDDILRQRPAEPKWPGRDRFILSKGHGCLALYAVLADMDTSPRRSSTASAISTASSAAIPRSSSRAWKPARGHSATACR